MQTLVNAGARLDRLPFGPFHRRMIRLVGIGMFFDGFDVSMASSVLAALTKSHWSTLSQNSAFISATFLGLAFGAFSTGILGDKFGRKFVYQFNLMIFAATCFLSTIAPSMTWLIILRGIMGVGVGAEYVIGYSFISEFVQPQRRGRILGIMSLISISAAFVGNVLGVLIIPHLGWRPMFLICGAGALWVWYLRAAVPESPRWLERNGSLDDAERVMSEIEFETSPTGGLPPVEPLPAVQAVQGPSVSMAVLFTRPVIRRTLLAVSINMIVFVGMFSFTYWMPTFFVQNGYSLQKSLSLWTFISFGTVVGPVICILISDWLGRRRAIIFGATACCIAALLYSQQHTLVGLLALGFSVMALMSLMTSLGIGAYSPELFPTEYRMRGAGFAQMCGRLAVMASPLLIMVLYRDHGVTAVMLAIASVYGLLAIIMVLFGIKTNQKSLEKIFPQ